MTKFKDKIKTCIYKDVILISSGIALKNFQLIKTTVFDNVSSSHFYKYAIYKLLTKKTIKYKSESVPFIIHNHWSSGYHHWITEALVRLLSVENYQHKVLLLTNNYPSFAYESLKLLGVKKVEKFSPKVNLKLKALEIPENPNSGFYNRDYLIRLKKLLIKHSKPTNNARIYITRKNAHKRKVENEKELHPILEKYGFKIIDADKLTFIEQVNLFTSCEFLISIHGAAITNCIFMPENSFVLEFYKSNTFINRCYERMTEALKINYNRIICEGGKNKESHVDVTDLVVNPSKFENVLINYIK